MNSLGGFGLISAGLLFASCGPSTSTAREPLEIPNTGSLLLLASGASPTSLLIKAGGTISLVNEDNVAPMVASNPFPHPSPSPPTKPPPPPPAPLPPLPSPPPPH